MSAARPYPNVLRRSRGRWQGVHPQHGRHRYLGLFTTPEAARVAVLLAQAEHLEQKAARYRREAAELEPGGEG